MAGLQAEEAVLLRESRLILTRGTAEARDIVGKYGYVRSIPLNYPCRLWLDALKEPLLKAGTYQPQARVFMGRRGESLTTPGLQHRMEEISEGQVSKI